MYYAFYNLKELPFRLTPDPRYLFLSSKHKEALAHLIFSIRQGSGFAVITGEIGTGKTTLVRTLLHDAEPDTISAYIFNPTLSALELLQAVNQEFGLPSPAGRKELMDTLNAFLLQQKEVGKTAVVIVDEAQALNPEALEQLRLLSNLETETEKLLQIILVGQPELRRLLARPELSQLKQRVSVSWHLTALERSETAAYVRHRLEVAAAGARCRIFSPWALRMIHAYSRGVPRTINILCDRALLVGFTMEREKIGATAVRRAVGELEAERWREPRSWLQSAMVAASAAGIVVACLIGLSAGDYGKPQRQAAASPAPVAAQSGLPQAQSMIEVQTEASPDPPPAPSSTAVQTVSSLSRPVGDQAGEFSGQPMRPEAQAERLFAKLAHMTMRESQLSALDQLLELWDAPPLSLRERQQEPLDLPTVASGRALNELSVSGTWERLRLLDLPAILELVLPHKHRRRLVTLARMGQREANLMLEGEPFLLPLGQLAESWHGDAHVFWRDYEDLPAVLAQGSVGPKINRLNALLQEAGIRRDLSAYFYDEVTAQAVALFQHKIGIRADGIVGPLTKILLYGSAPRYGSPRLSDKGSQ